MAEVQTEIKMKDQFFWSLVNLSSISKVKNFFFIFVFVAVVVVVVVVIFCQISP